VPAVQEASMRATIIGAGIAGLALAKGLRAIGIDVEVFEQAPELKPVGAGIALTANGLRALQSLGLYEAVIERGEEIRRISVLDEQGRILETTDHLRLTERFGHVSAVALHRSALHEALLSNLPADVVHTAKQCTGVQQNANEVEVLFEDGSNMKTDLLLACDGIHSAVRRSLYPQWRERYAGYTCWRGIVHQRLDDVESSHMTESWGKDAASASCRSKADRCTGLRAEFRGLPMIGRSPQWDCPSFASCSRNSIDPCARS
jgi:2-polyprenyl-6-methoxyphenol hydroxylase-like FAD-dependent oxidoreductase